MSGSPPLTQAWVNERLQWFGMAPLLGEPVVWRDTSRYLAIERDHIIDVGGTLYFIRGNAHEGRFGLDEQPKFWVKRAIDLNTGQTHILKLVIQESFKVSVGETEVLCVRSADKESRVLDLVRGDPRFMQGRTACDSQGNPVRVIDFIYGTDLLTHLDSIPMPHKQYCHTKLPSILAKVGESVAGIGRLHEAGLCHGDIRNDHILVERGTACYKWIDFDLDQGFVDFDIWSVGNILHYVVAKGFLTFRDAVRARPELSGGLLHADASVFFPHRIMNLHKVYPYLPQKLNDVLLRFSFGAAVRYNRVSQIAEDVGECVASMKK